MTTLLSFRDNVKTFLGHYDFIVTPILKGIFAFFLLLMLNNQMGYFAALDNVVLLLGIACVCAFLPSEMLAGIGYVIVVLHSMKVSIEVGLLAVALILIFYFAYMRFSPKTGIIALVIPMCYTLHIVYAIPIVLGVLVGPVAIVPAVFGVILYYYQTGLVDVSNMLATATEDEAVQGYQYIIALLVDNKFMLLTIVAFACVILITYFIYRLSFSNSWIVAIVVGGLLNVVMFLAGSVTLAVKVELSSILLGSLVGILIAVVLQFCKGIVDYQRTEILQFEDDDYYYYVKAVPKLSVSGMNKSVKHINSKTHNKME
ncbi:MAG: hypothetical protein IJD40_06095 [Lachnospiraceae bacterium]|nr:hypothetical protein [Lachnospiraceae bacterium]